MQMYLMNVNDAVMDIRQIFNTIHNPYRGYGEDMRHALLKEDYFNKEWKPDKKVLEARIDQTDALLEEIGGQLTKDESKRLILKKLYDIVSDELDRYLNAEKRLLIQGIENLWNKYAVSNKTMEEDREKTLELLNIFLQGLGYLK